MVRTITVLDHGFVRLHNISGPTRRMHNEVDASDEDPANVARMSFDAAFEGRTHEDEMRLCDYLMRNWHTTPFETIEVWLEMKLPIFVARQFVRHRTASINEVSGRYITLPEEWYIPNVVGAKPDKAKQGQVDTLDFDTQHWFKNRLNQQCQESYSAYTVAIEAGVAPEHARLLLHLNHYTRWMWKQNLHNMMHFLSLRDHSHAQIEAQMYAKAIDTLLRSQLPGIMQLYDKYRKQHG